MRFSDFHAGQVIHAGPVSLTEAEILEFAGRYDPQWFHTDPERAATGRHGGLIASGWQTCGLAMRMAVEVGLGGDETIGSPGLAYLRWPAPVRPGDELRLELMVLETRRSKSQPGMGILRWRWRMFNQHGAEVLDLEATSLFDVGGPPA